MKRLLIIILLSSIWTIDGKAALGNSSGGGGTIVSANFVAHGEFALKMLKITMSELSEESIDQAINATSVYDLEEMCYQNPNDGSRSCFDALYGLGVIHFSLKSWNQMKCNEKLALTAHEYLRATGLEESNYKYSYSFISGSYSNDPDINLTIENEINSWCARNINKSIKRF